MTALEHRLDLRLSQKLVLTPQLQQAIKLLQMPQLELAQTLTQELTENPFLEELLDEHEEEIPTLDPRTDDEPVTPDVDYDTAELTEESFTKFSVDEYFEERGSDGRDLGYFNPGTEERPSYELFYSRKPDLYDHLLWQLRLSTARDEVRIAAESVIGNIEDDGYLRISDEELARTAGVSSELIAEAVALVQGFDPPGVCARSLQDCLMLQLRTLGLEDTLVARLVRGNMEDIQKHKFQQIARAYAMPLEDIMAAVRIIEALDPRPASKYTGEETTYVVPDVFITRTDEGYQIVLNDEGMPRLRLNGTYRALLTRKEQLTKEEKAFLREKLRLATELIKSLDQRNRTIYRVADSILKFQMEFFERGRQQLRPLTLKDVATDVGMHESTISRVTSNKYLACDHGVFSFRFFFSSALQSDTGEVSSTSVKDLIRKIIEEEDPKKPLSDKMIADRLRGENVTIARRTVAKYREELKIAPQNMRKRYD
ncbi:MAG: RNA polymerase factor sigma-54 [Nitrospiraceae bacterium]|jgi:RNA polymerase sigma-54 factor|nr:RNA polymerase factor sigma-54 [Nitrospiraceae bacterium]